MSTRTGFLSDENIKKICLTQMQIPMNRMDLLPANPINVSEIYSRPLKEPPILKRPANAAIMLAAAEKLTGVNMAGDFLEEYRKKIPDKAPPSMLPFAPGGVTQQTYTTLRNIPVLSELAYLQQFANVGMAPTIYSDILSGPNSSLSLLSQDTQSEFSSVTTPSIEEDEEARQARLEVLRMGRYGYVPGSEELEALIERPESTVLPVGEPGPSRPPRIATVETTTQTLEEFEEGAPVRERVRVFERFGRSRARVAPEP